MITSKYNSITYCTTNPQEAEEALFQQAAVSSSLYRKGLPTTPWNDAIQQNNISKKNLNKIIYQSITRQSSLHLSWLL
jgi:hypothetical protein